VLQDPLSVNQATHWHPDRFGGRRYCEPPPAGGRLCSNNADASLEASALLITECCDTGYDVAVWLSPSV
jgi:hypothetical protein